MNKEQYDKNIRPKMQELAKACAASNTPFFASVALNEDNENKTTYEVACLTPGVAGVVLNEDKITRMLNVINGFDTVPPHQTIEIDF